MNKFPSFSKLKRFDKNGIFGDIFDHNKKMKFGQPDQSSIDFDNVEIAKNKYTKPRLKN